MHRAIIWDWLLLEIDRYIIGGDMKKRAAIYIRTSSEHQGAKASPDEQEADYRKLAEDNGLIVEAVYRDTERYRVKNRLVDPSGT